MYLLFSSHLPLSPNLSICPEDRKRKFSFTFYISCLFSTMKVSGSGKQKGHPISTKAQFDAWVLQTEPLVS